MRPVTGDTSGPAVELRQRVVPSWEPLARLLRQPASALGAAIVAVFLATALLGPALAPYGENEQLPGQARQAPSAAHWFGTDRLGRDVFSRVVLGARDILALAGTGTMLALLAGTALGLVSGYRGGWLDELLMRAFDSLLAVPAMLLALLLLGSFGPSRPSILIVIVVVYTPVITRVVRSAVLGTRGRAYVDAARLQGETLGWILLREILPAVLPALAVEAALRFSYSIFLVSSLGFLGIGAQPPSPDWGLMVSEARSFTTQTPWAIYFPAAAIAVVVVGVNLLADGLRRVLQAPAPELLR